MSRLGSEHIQTRTAAEAARNQVIVQVRTVTKTNYQEKSTRRVLIMQAQDDACPITALLARASLTRSMSSVGARSTCFDTLTSTYVESNTC